MKSCWQVNHEGAVESSRWNVALLQQVIKVVFTLCLMATERHKSCSSGENLFAEARGDELTFEFYTVSSVNMLRGSIHVICLLFIYYWHGTFPWLRDGRFVRSLGFTGKGGKQSTAVVITSVKFCLYLYVINFILHKSNTSVSDHDSPPKQGTSYPEIQILMVYWTTHLSSVQFWIGRCVKYYNRSG